jgi:hypothetical protein
MAQAITIRIGAVGDPPIFPEHSKATEGKIIGVSILEKGMESGKTSVGIFVETDGKKSCVQLSADMLNGINSAVRGAVERFEGPSKN